MLETIKLTEALETEPVNCDLCGSSQLVFWDSARSNTLTKCSQCGLVFTNPRIIKSEDKDRLIYTASYFQQKSRMTQKLIKARQKTYRKEIATLTKMITNGSILDVGCGMGLFLECLEPSWEKHGCDVSSYALEEARKRRVTVYHGEFEKLDFGNAQFDIIYFRASLHHAYSPRKCLEKAKKLLRPGGFLAITMSNDCGGLCGKLFKGHIKSYDQSCNYLFSKRSLSHYLNRCGFKVLTVQHPYFKTGYASWQDIINLPFYYAQYLYMKKTGRLNKPDTFDFASPTFYGNYINIYARKSN